VLGEVGLDQLSEREPACDPSFPAKPLELAVKRVTRVLFRRETPTLQALGVAPRGVHKLGRALEGRDLQRDRITATGCAA
jgi:hypothetical protein